MPQTGRDRLLNAAQARLLAHGPGGLVLDAIAADAGMSKGGLLHHFRTKEALVEGLCDRMLASFDERLEALVEADPNPTGAWSRAYLASTVGNDGKAADDSARLMAGILSTLGHDSTHLERVREHFAKWQRRLENDSIDPTAATLVRLAADGLWLSSLLGLPEIGAKRGREVVRELRRLADG